jgi:hypothetical protein
LCLHYANRAVSTERRVLPNTRRYANHWVTVLIRINERQGHGSEFSLRNENLSGQAFAGTWRFVVAERCFLVCPVDRTDFCRAMKISARTEKCLSGQTFAGTCDLFTNCHCVMTTAAAAVLAESERFSTHVKNSFRDEFSPRQENPPARRRLLNRFNSRDCHTGMTNCGRNPGIGWPLQSSADLRFWRAPQISQLADFVAGNKLSARADNCPLMRSVPT